MKFSTFIKEEVPTNNASSGNVKGMGGASGEPGVKKKKAQNMAPLHILKLLRRYDPQRKMKESTSSMYAAGQPERQRNSNDRNQAQIDVKSHSIRPGLVVKDKEGALHRVHFVNGMEVHTRKVNKDNDITSSKVYRHDAKDLQKT